jgi:hypothetical protein
MRVSAPLSYERYMQRYEVQHPFYICALMKKVTVETSMDVLNSTLFPPQSFIDLQLWPIHSEIMKLSVDRQAHRRFLSSYEITQTRGIRSSGLSGRVVQREPDILENHIASVFRVEK